MGVPAAATIAEELASLPTDVKALRRGLRHLFNGNPERAEETRLVLGRMLPEGLKLRRDQRGKLKVLWGLKLVDLPVRMVAGGAMPTNSALVIPLSRADRRGKIARVQIPDHCGNGHRLTVGNVRMDQRERRWRCRQCGNDRAAAFRDRQRRG